MEKRELICIGCPLGCMLEATIENGQVTGVKGNTCKRGEDYAKKECVSPTRIVTSSVKVTGGAMAMASVKTRTDIPKGKIRECMRALKDVSVAAPVTLGEVILENVADTGVDIIATRAVAKK